MSQEYSKKTPSRFQPELDANSLCSYTTHILVNRKYFPEEVQQTIVPGIVELVLRIAEKTNIANSVSVKPTLPPEKLVEAYKLRISMQSEVLRDLHQLKARVQLLKLGYHLAKHKANAWMRKTNETIYSISAWRSGEIKRVKELL